MHRPDKIFGIGPARTGTTSLAHAMKMLGYDVVHNPRTMREIEKYDFCGDISTATLFEFLDYAFPKARFIFTTRDIESWLESCRISSAKRGGKHTNEGWLDIPLRRAYPRWLFSGITYYDEEIFRRAWKNFHERVFNYFKGRKNKLLIMDICTGDGWKKLCTFLNKPILDIPFPYKNRRTKYIKKGV